jgi:membrane fusion protein (multidrug efflux system)
LKHKVCYVKTLNPFLLRLFFLAVLILCEIVCEGQGSVEVAPNQSARPIEILTVEEATIAEKYQYSGVLRAFKEVKLSNEIAGVIEDYRVDKGSRVNSGDLLVSIDDDDYRRKVEEMEARLEKAIAVRGNAEREHERKKRLHANSVISDSALDQQYLTYQTAKADEKLATVLLEQAREDLSKTRITSPFDGIILEKYREVGELIPSGTILLQVADYTRVKLELGVSEKDIVHVHENSAVEVLVDPFPGEIFPGSINYVGVNVASETGTFPVEIVIQNPSSKLLPGMISRSSISGEVHSGLLLVPQASLKKQYGSPVVFLEKDGKAVLRSVLLGKVFGEWIEIVEGISAGDHVITTGLVDLRAGDVVTIDQRG